MTDLFQNSISGLAAFQRALATTSHNIANVNTEGYSRQRVEFGTRTPQARGDGFIGSGVEAQTVKRIFDQARQTAVEKNTAEFRRLDVTASLAGRIDDLLADQSAGLSPALQGFFNAVQEVANDPSASTARQALLTAGEGIADRLSFLDERFAAISGDVDTQLRGGVAEINEPAGSIASLNESILAERGRTGDHPSNDLLDQRDRLVTQLSSMIGTDVQEQDNGSFNVFIGNGQPQVTGPRANRLEVVPGTDDPEEPAIALTDANGDDEVRITGSVQGGELGGLLDFRREILDPTRDELGRVAASIALTVNQQQNRGFQFDGDPDGQLGEDFFNLGDPTIVARPGNAGAGEIAVRYAADAPAELTGSNYRLRYEGGDEWLLTRLSDGQETPLDESTGDFPAVVDGIEIDINADPDAGDSFLIRPTRDVAQSLEVALSRPGQIAAASPLVAEEATDGRGQAINGGTGRISGLQVNSTDGLPPDDAADPLTLTFDADENEYLITDAAGNDYGSIAYAPATDSGGLDVSADDPAYTAGADGSIADIGDVAFTLDGTPEDDDSFTIGRNRNARGDNTNALAMGELANKAILDGGETTFQEGYAGLVGEVGTSTLRAQINRDAQETVLRQAEAARESVSGVNLEEEAANLLKYQKAFQASAQAIAIANGLFDSLLAAVQR